MADQPFDRTIIHPLEKPLADDINQALSQVDRSIRFFLKHLFSSNDGFVGNSLQVVAQNPTGMEVVVKAGLGLQNDSGDTPSSIDAGDGSVEGLDDLEPYKPIPLVQDHTFTVPTAPSGGNSRIDIVEVKADRAIANPSSRQVLDEGSGAFNAETINKILSFALDSRSETIAHDGSPSEPLVYKTGQAAGSPSAPSTDTGYIKVAEITVGEDVTEITDDDITDEREDLERPDEVLMLHPSLAQAVVRSSSGDLPYASGNGGVWASVEGPGDGFIHLPITLPVGSTIQEVEVFLLEDDAETWFVKLESVDPTDGSKSEDLSQKSSGTTAGFAQLEWTKSGDPDDLPLEIQDNKTYRLELFIEGTTAAEDAQFLGARVVFKRPKSS